MMTNRDDYENLLRSMHNGEIEVDCPRCDETVGSNDMSSYNNSVFLKCSRCGKRNKVFENGGIIVEVCRHWFDKPNEIEVVFDKLKNVMTDEEINEIKRLLLEYRKAQEGGGMKRRSGSMYKR